MTSPDLILYHKRLAAIKLWLQANNWTPTANDYDYALAHQYALNVLNIPRRDRARQYVAKAARQLRGEFVQTLPGRPIKFKRITVEEYKQLLENAKNNEAPNDEH